MKKGDQSEDDPRDEEERLLIRHWDHPRFWCSPPDLHRFPSQRDRSAENDHRQSRLCPRGHHPSSSRNRFSKTARNLSRILGLNDLSSASVSKPSSTNSEGMEDKTLMTPPDNGEWC